MCDVVRERGRERVQENVKSNMMKNIITLAYMLNDRVFHLQLVWLKRNEKGIETIDGMKCSLPLPQPLVRKQHCMLYEFTYNLKYDI